MIKKIRSRIGIAKNNFTYSLYYSKYYDEVLDSIKNIHSGKRCFYIGTGPSINKEDLSLLKDEITFGVNETFRLDIDTKYYMVVGENAMPRYYKELEKLDTTLFLGGSAGRWYLKNKIIGNAIVIKDIGELEVWKNTIPDIKKGIRGGRSILVSTLQLINYFGFTTTYLLGCDFDYYSGKESHAYEDGIGEPNRNWDIVSSNLEIIKKEFESNGKKIYNCTQGSKLDVFEKRRLCDII